MGDMARPQNYGDVQAIIRSLLGVPSQEEWAKMTPEEQTKAMFTAFAGTTQPVKGAVGGVVGKVAGKVDDVAKPMGEFALRMKDGRTLTSKTARIHADMLDEFGIDPLDIAEGGFIRGGKFEAGSGNFPAQNPDPKAAADFWKNVPATPPAGYYGPPTASPSSALSGTKVPTARLDKEVSDDLAHVLKKKKGMLWFDLKDFGSEFGVQANLTDGHLDLDIPEIGKGAGALGVGEVRRIARSIRDQVEALGLEVKTMGGNRTMGARRKAGVTGEMKVDAERLGSALPAVTAFLAASGAAGATAVGIAQRKKGQK